MPRLSHKKTRTGCQRCKARKVKCDEAKPTCSACARHKVSCEYSAAAPRRSAVQTPSTVSPPGDSVGITSCATDPDVALDGGLEIRLMHEWTAYTCHTFSTSFEFWRYQAPLIAMEHRFALDAMFALAALNASRQSPTQWIAMEDRMVPLRDPMYHQGESSRDPGGARKQPESMADDVSTTRAVSRNLAYLSAKRSHEMLKHSEKYFSRAVYGHRRSTYSVDLQNIEALYMASVLLSFYALFTLSEDEGDPTLPGVDPLLWLHLADGTQALCDDWRKLVGDDWMKFAGVYYGVPELTEFEASRKEPYGSQFERILKWATEYENMTTEDRECYERALDYVGLTYKGISNSSEHELASCRRLVAMPSRLPRRFTELIENESPRALVILAFAFAVMKLLSKKVPWFAGIAEKQVPRIFEKLPIGWKEMMKWPMMVTNGEAGLDDDREVQDIVSL